MATGDYTTLAEVKNFFLEDRDADATDDGVIEAMISQYSRWIDEYCRRWFYADTHTRYYDVANPPIDGRTLYLDADLQSVTTLTNGDGTTLTEDTHFILRSTNEHYPNVNYYDRVVLLSSAGATWSYVDDPEEAISIAGVWGYCASDSHPTPVEQACLLLVQHAYYRRNNPEGRVTARTASGATIMGTSLPKDVYELLAPFRRRRFG